MGKIQDALKKIQGDEADRSATARPRAAVKRGARIDGKPVSGDGTVTQPSRIVAIDMEALRNDGLVAAVVDQRLIADQFGEIKRPLIAHAFGRRATKVPDGHLIMVSSALSGEGKTFTVLNLALSMAQEQDYSVLLIDADVAKPHISEVLDVADAPGLLDAIDDRSIDPESLVMPTNRKGLSILPAGRRRPNATELLASTRMDEVISALEQRGQSRILLFDSAPLLMTTESKIIASIAGQIVLVVRAESTEQGVVNSALELLDEEKAVSMILNQARALRDGHVYGYDGPSGRYAETEEVE